ncbi:hypothetical protein BZL29_8511 [Mycobacterium kansasii]|uniref:Uncharacterized protein n=1 Tax=Mycobacterium kansasii TaxID=1768 RepID=A0A1V3W9D4_MYCKA|nr:hypothetical protein BZL29_8511 [Mycobacterium kansasii]
MDIPGRDQLEQALQNADWPSSRRKVDEHRHRRSQLDDKSRLRAELEALVNEANESELAR